MAIISEEVKKSIIDEMADVLNERYYNFERNYLEDITSECFEQKKELFDLFSHHANWNPEKLMIQFDADYERKICTEELRRFCNWFKTIKRIDTWSEHPRKEYLIYQFIYSITEQFFNESMAMSIAAINELNDNYKLRANMKASKAIGKIFREEGWDKLEGYNQYYAALCDCLNPIKVRRHTCISLNPIDFLLMSNGTSWHSCHDIGERGDSGCYSAGTVSYMLDNHSFVFYTVDAEFDGTDIELEDKVQRQMFGYNDETLCQLRLYPQSNDSGADQIYEDIRAIVQKVIADCLNKPNLWSIAAKDSRRAEVNEVVKAGDGACCYPDWQGNNPGSAHCSISTHKERANGKEHRKIVFGARPICISCGERHTYTNSISCCDGEDCYYCTCCDCRIYEDDVYWIDDEPYCYDCVTYCEECGDYYRNDDVIDVNDYYMCRHCLERELNKGNLFVCEDCGEYVWVDDVVITNNGHHYCNDCASEHTFYCDECDETFDNDEPEYFDEETGLTYCQHCWDQLQKQRAEEAKELTARIKASIEKSSGNVQAMILDSLREIDAKLDKFSSV